MEIENWEKKIIQVLKSTLSNGALSWSKTFYTKFGYTI